ncbi:hypothetical protein ABB37_02163 [Leptomonas pyrrhocoris]|uniref:Reverse transcriptase domain-containing protein n=1 Tax=Leptomonas pyrrhocoris TaxID=157538 RepID=A0A0N0DYE6_LEPPY|nr:hypothetical protein ABB37_08892 [Leptomonas pyrrhocoris]XP_015661668.1 hypothetical protein ABB37_02909 [Leptomonas pyrrhocoris]XP_015662471.1 hypothetical protein ABB37_02163 [Leptomonas pyrrhocoris]KPA74892.1 hypothetical protein ABB37_08892 [Leptomonas pyrrhocoris]KPA83229.1 hypothetical protein ABB37_02909 [Leptomonas pyrrhocoris]KPA84032.1 hypothetical protein ABB37_02163 [Leptomonas pyrrhocoris]|eukprot:XP_015653331.1 hypothetical protein ABB37_08892 [Leptomonas pyrrhocoris]
MDVELLKARMLPAVAARFNELWRQLGSGEGKSPGPQGSHRICTADALALRAGGIIGPASDAPTKGWVVPFSVVEEKSTGTRLRWIAWPRVKNATLEDDADVPLEHVARYLPAVHAEVAACLDLKASFYQVPLPVEARACFRCIAENGAVMELHRLPMGYRASPEVMQLLTSAVRSEYRAPPEVHIDVWIDNIRLWGTEAAVQEWTKRVLLVATEAQVTWGETLIATPRYQFVGVSFDHCQKTVKLGD